MNLQSENINELATALSKAQGRIVTAKKDKQNPYFKSSYADLSSVWDACRTALSDNGLAIVQAVQTTDNRMELVTTLAHSSGQWIKSQMPVITAKNDPQSIGSALTYYRRYALAAMVGVAASEEDDDGNKASDRRVEEKVITYAQAEELEAMFNTVPDYRTEVLKFLEGSYKISKFSQIPVSLYDRIKSGVTKKVADYYADDFSKEPKKSKGKINEPAGV